VVPDLSSAASRVSEIVSTAIFSGTNCRLSSMPAIAVPLNLAGEGIARRYLSLFQPSHEPALPLRRRAVGKSIRHDVTARLLLKTIIADRRCGLHRRLDIARLDRIPALVRIVRPNSGETIGLQFDPHLDPVGLDLAACRALRILHLRQNAEQVL